MPWTLSVSELNDYVRRALASDPSLRFLSLRGEISDFKKYASGHWYFTLKDEQSRIQCVCYRQNAMRISFQPENGMKVVLTGAVGLYTVSGSYQFYAENITQDGVGELYLKYEALKNKLLKEGLFDVARKRQLPLLPRAIGVVTSRSGAVIHDIATVTRRRYPAMQIILRPAQVQGEGAAEDIAQGIAEISMLPQVDVIIVGRGGGSLEDLWAFNEEIVVRAIAACPVPVVSAVGHEVDVTLSDLAADLRAATPSAAAELCVPERETLLHTIAKMRSDVERAGKNRLLSLSSKLGLYEKRLAARHPAAQIQNARARADILTQKMQALADRQFTYRRSRLSLLSDKLAALGPRQALSRGYAILLDGKTPVTSVDAAKEEMTLLLQDGRMQIRASEIRKEDPFGQETAQL
ncbi:MAG: exodeoxyribonuclease VII large subunit [Clostridiales bacterium]|nr:exodeoxyribonuclease VII large subunit [Clostridiales bacterium]